MMSQSQQVPNVTDVSCHAHSPCCFQGVFYTVPLSLAAHDHMRGVLLVLHTKLKLRQD